MSIRILYFVAIFVCVGSVFLSGVKNKPLRQIKEDKSVRSYTTNIDYHYLSNSSDFEFYQSDYNKLPAVKIPIDKRTSPGTGTAFKIGFDTWVTARHVVEGCLDVLVLQEKVTNIIIPFSSDLALLKTKPFESRTDQKFNSDIKKSTRPGQEGFSIGFPTGKPGQAYLIFAGYVKMIQTGAYNLNEPVRMWVERQRQPKRLDMMGGISGAPIFDSDGNILGVHVANTVRRGRAFSVSEESLSDLINRSESVESFEGISFKNSFNVKNYGTIANTLRAGKLIAKISCTI